MVFRSLYKKKASLRVFLWLLPISSAISAEPPILASDMHILAISTTAFIYNEQYNEAKDEARKIIRRYPAHPAGYFFMAAAIDSWMTTHFSDKQENEFYRYCDLVVEKGEKALEKNPDDQWAKFFIGGAEGYKGTYEARYERWITAFRYGWKGVSTLMQLQENKSSIVDLSYGIGNYEYWRSALMKNLWWMPGVEDKRREGIEKLQKARNEGVYVKVAASVSLMDIFSNEKKYGEALLVADDALSRHPKSLMFIFGKAKLLFKLNRFAESRALFRKALLFVETDPDGNRAAIAFCHFWIAKNEFLLEHFNECIIECERMKSYGLTEDSRKIMQKYYTEIESIHKQATNGMKKNG